VKPDDQTNASAVHGFYNVIRPDNAATCQLRAQISLLFPKYKTGVNAI
jgi:hypothetical protein